MLNINTNIFEVDFIIAKDRKCNLDESHLQFKFPSSLVSFLFKSAQMGVRFLPRIIQNKTTDFTTLKHFEYPIQGTKKRIPTYSAAN